MQKQDLILRFLLKFRPFGMEVAYTLIGGGHFRSFCPALVQSCAGLFREQVFN